MHNVPREYKRLLQKNAGFRQLGFRQVRSRPFFGLRRDFKGARRGRPRCSRASPSFSSADNANSPETLGKRRSEGSLFSATVFRRSTGGGHAAGTPPGSCLDIGAHPVAPPTQTDSKFLENVTTSARSTADSEQRLEGILMKTTFLVFLNGF